MSLSSAYIRHRETIALHGGYDGYDHQRSAAVPIYQTSSFLFDDTDHAASLFNLTQEGYIYSRTGNPTLDTLEKRLTLLEGGIGAVSVASGMAAIDTALSTLVRSGDHIVSSQALYGGTANFLSHILTNRGVHVDFFPVDQLEHLRRSIRPSTKAIFIESISNPGGRLADIKEIASIAHQHGIPLIVDNTVASPAGIRPFEHGADIVVHSLTKYIAGHGNALGGVVIDRGQFDWTRYPDKFPQFVTPNPAYHGVVFSEHFGQAAYIALLRTGPLRSAGAVLSANAAFLILQGLETLNLRYERIALNTQKILQFLIQHPLIKNVSHLSLETHPDHQLAGRYLDLQGVPGLISFEIDTHHQGVRDFYDHLNLFLRLVNIGDSKSLATIPALTTHRQLPADVLEAQGITPNLVRLSIGIEHSDDLIHDLQQALDIALSLSLRSEYANASL